MFLQILTSKSSYLQRNKVNFIKFFNKNVKIQFINNSKYIKKKNRSSNCDKSLQKNTSQ